MDFRWWILGNICNTTWVLSINICLLYAYMFTHIYIYIYCGASCYTETRTNLTYIYFCYRYIYIHTYIYVCVCAQVWYMTHSRLNNSRWEPAPSPPPDWKCNSDQMYWAVWYNSVFRQHADLIEGWSHSGHRSTVVLKSLRVPLIAPHYAEER